MSGKIRAGGTPEHGTARSSVARRREGATLIRGTKGLAEAADVEQ